ncbi:MAG: hypothetical protein KGH72_03695 [Candidatus Micrarchaeota archaeon]|nr:hypothetical protein [Candidatus Micrarchaeota archaeon]
MGAGPRVRMAEATVDAALAKGIAALRSMESAPRSYSEIDKMFMEALPLAKGEDGLAGIHLRIAKIWGMYARANPGSEYPLRYRAGHLRDAAGIAADPAEKRRMYLLASTAYMLVIDSNRTRLAVREAAEMDNMAAEFASTKSERRADLIRARQRLISQIGRSHVNLGELAGVFEDIARTTTDPENRTKSELIAVVLRRAA